MSLVRTIWVEEDGGLSFEWALALTLVVIGVVAGLAAARDAVIDELGDTAQAMLALDGSFAISQPLAVSILFEGQAVPTQIGGASDSGFSDRAIYSDCGRGNFAGQDALADSDS